MYTKSRVDRGVSLLLVVVMIWVYIIPQVASAANSSRKINGITVEGAKISDKTQKIGKYNWRIRVFETDDSIRTIVTTSNRNRNFVVTMLEGHKVENSSYMWDKKKNRYRKTVRVIEIPYDIDVSPEDIKQGNESVAATSPKKKISWSKINRCNIEKHIAGGVH